MDTLSTSLSACFNAAIQYNGCYSSQLPSTTLAPATLYYSPSLIPPQLPSTLSQPSHLDLWHRSIIHRLSQLAEESRPRSASPFLFSSGVKASRDTSPTSESGSPSSEASSDLNLTLSFTYTIHKMARASQKCSSARRPSEPFHMRTRRSRLVSDTSPVAGQQLISASTTASMSSPAPPTPDLTHTCLTDSSSPMPALPSSQDSTYPTAGMAQNVKASVPQINRQTSPASSIQTSQSGTVAAGKRQKTSYDADEEAVLLDHSYYARHDSLEDEFKRIAEAASQSSGDSGTSRRTTRSKTHPVEPSTPVMQATKPTNKRKASETTETSSRSSVALETSKATSVAPESSFKSGELSLSSTTTSVQSNEPGVSRAVSETTSSTPNSSTSAPWSSKEQYVKARFQKFLSSLKQKEKEVLKPKVACAYYGGSLSKSKESWPEYHALGTVMFGADGKSPYGRDLAAKDSPTRKAAAKDSPAGGSPANQSPKPARGSGRGGRGGARGGRGGGRGNGGRGRPRGRKAGKEESPEPPPRRNLADEEEEKLRRLKQRQQELKKFFGIVGAHHADMLDQLAVRDLTRMVRKPRAHIKVPEFEAVKADLNKIMEERQALVEKKYEIGVAAEMKRYEQEKELIEMQFCQRCEQAKMEHTQGNQGEMVSLREAHTLAQDDTRTQAGSEIDYFPRYHELPEPDAHVRGYTSSKITDEKPFKKYLESHTDQTIQEVINEDITQPMIESLARENAKHEEEQRVKKTQTMKTLVAVSSEELEKMSGYLIERPMSSRDMPNYALSALADAADFVTQQHPHQQYIYMPLAPGEHLSASVFQHGPLPGQNNGRPLAPAPTAVPPQPISVTTVPSKRSRTKSKASISSVQSIRPSLHVQTQPNGVPRASPVYTASPIVSTGPGQPIAPAPPKSLPVSGPVAAPPPPFRRPSEPASYRPYGFPVGPASTMPLGPPSSVPASPRSGPSPRHTLPGGGQQFIFQPPAGMPASPRAGFRPSSPLSGPSTGKIPVQFVNQTVASRKAAAAKKKARQSGEERSDCGDPAEKREGMPAGGGGAVRMLLPKQ